MFESENHRTRTMFRHREDFTKWQRRRVIGSSQRSGFQSGAREFTKNEFA